MPKNANCQVEVDLPNNRKGSDWEKNCVMSEIEEKKSDFNQVKIQYTPRSSNANENILLCVKCGTKRTK